MKESDYEVKVKVVEPQSSPSYVKYDFTTTAAASNILTLGDTTWITNYPYHVTPTYSWYSWPSYIYLYDIKCPKRSCKTRNWLQINIVSPCKGCGARLKAVADDADFEIPIDTSS